MATATVVLNYIEDLIWPVLAIVLLVILVPMVSRWRRIPESEPLTATPPGASAFNNPGGGDLTGAIDDAEGLESLAMTPSGDPLIQLQQAIQVRASSYRESAQKIVDSYRAGRVVVVDLSAGKESTAVRLVDFCSGITLISRGSFYQISRTVLVLTPRTDPA